MANAGRGLGHAFLDQDFGKARRVIDTNITGTVYLIHKVGNDMRRRNSGKILITGSIAGFIPGSFQAVYNGTKAFLNSFSFALREELKDTKVTVTCLMPGATETEFFRRADMMDTAVGTTEKDDPAEVANNGFDAMMKGEGDVVSGFKNKVQVRRGQRDAGRRSGQPASQDGRTRHRKEMIESRPKYGPPLISGMTSHGKLADRRALARGRVSRSHQQHVFDGRQSAFRR